MKRLIKSFKYAFTGIYEAFTTEPNLKIHFIATIIVLAAGVFFALHSWEWVVLIICISLVISAEMFNSSIEAMIDFLHPDKNAKVKRIKDMAAGAVLIAAIGSVIVGLVIFLPKIFILLSH